MFTILGIAFVVLFLGATAWLPYNDIRSKIRAKHNAEKMRGEAEKKARQNLAGKLLIVVVRATDGRKTFIESHVVQELLAHEAIVVTVSPEATKAIAGWNFGQIPDGHMLVFGKSWSKPGDYGTEYHHLELRIVDQLGRVLSAAHSSDLVPDELAKRLVREVGSQMVAAWPPIT